MPKNLRVSKKWHYLTTAAVAFAAVSGMTGLAFGGGGGPKLPTLGEIGKEVENGFQHAGDSAADIVTLGENGRRRDRERAEAAAALAAAERANVERLKQEKIAALKDQIALLEGVAKYHVANNALADQIWKAHNLIVSLGTEELESRKRAFAFMEKFRESNRKSQSDLTLLAEVLASLKVLDTQLASAVQTKDQPMTDTAKAERDKALSVTTQILNTANVEGSTAAAHLDTAIEALKTESLNSLVKTSLAARQAVSELRIQLQTQAADTDKALESKKSELKQLMPA